MSTVVRFSAEQADREIGHLASLLVDAVESGVSVGFMPPLSHAEALAYWRGVVRIYRRWDARPVGGVGW